MLVVACVLAVLVGAPAKKKGPSAPAKVEAAKSAPAKTEAAKPAPAPAPVAPVISDAKPIDLIPAAAIAPVAGGPEVARALRVAVYDFELSGVEPNIGAVVTASALAEARKLAGVSAIGMDEIKDMLSHEANKQFLGCEASESCLAEIAGALGVDELLSGKLAKVDDGTVFILRRIDQQRAKVVGVVNKRLASGSGEEFLAALGPAVEELFPERQLKEGQTRGVPKEMALRLNPPPLPSWTTLAVGGGAVALAAVGGVFGIFTMNAQEQYDTLANSTSVIEGKDLVARGNDVESNARNANIFFIGSGVLALGAGVMALFTDWNGYAEQSAVKP